MVNTSATYPGFFDPALGYLGDARRCRPNRLAEAQSRSWQSRNEPA
ncbi:hypothetical protein [Glutamicibacter sp. 363]